MMTRDDLLRVSIFITALMLAALVAISILAMTRAAGASPSCMTMREARKEYPNVHLWQHRGCWVDRRGGRRSKPATEPKPMPEPRHLADANGGAALAQEPSPVAPVAEPEPEPPPPLDLFLTPKEPMREWLVPEYAKKKTDRLAITPLAAGMMQDKIESPPDPPPPPQPIGVKPNWTLWLTFGFAWALFTALIILILRLPGLLPLVRQKLTGSGRQTDDRTRHPTARPDYQPETSRQRAPARSDGARNQQSHFYPWEFSRWRWRTDIRGHAMHPDPVADRRDDFTAIGAWAKSRGLRSEEPDHATESDDRGCGRKRFAFFARR